MANSKFVYRGKERTTEGITRKNSAGSSYDSYLPDDVQTFKAKEGDGTVRILPPSWEDLEKYGDGWELGIWLHYNVGPDNGAYLCSDKMNGERCPICEARNKTDDQDEQDKLRPSYRCLAWIIDRDNEKAGPLIWSMPVTLFKDINGRSIDKRNNLPILIDDPEEGFDVLFTRQGTDLKTKYTAVEVVRDPSPIHEDEKLQKRWLDYIMDNPLPELLKFYPADYLEKILFGRKARSTEYEDEPVATGRRRRGEDPPEETTTRRSRTREEPAEESETTSRRRGTQDEPDAGEEAEQPSTTRRRLNREPEGEPEQTERSSRRRELLRDGEEEVPSETEGRRGRGASRSEEEEETTTPSAGARSRLAALKERTGRSRSR